MLDSLVAFLQGADKGGGYRLISGFYFTRGGVAAAKSALFTYKGRKLAPSAQAEGRQHCRLSIFEYWLSWTNTRGEREFPFPSIPKNL